MVVKVYTCHRTGKIMRVNVREARSRFSSLLHEVEEGREVSICKRGNEIARLVPALKKHHLEDLSEFRNGISIKGASVGSTIIESRKEERY